MKVSQKHLDEISEKFADTFQYNGWVWGNLSTKPNEVNVHVPTKDEIAREIVELVSDFTDDTSWVESGRIRVERGSSDSHLIVLLVAEQEVIPVVERTKRKKKSSKKANS